MHCSTAIDALDDISSVGKARPVDGSAKQPAL
jgi:hypothetical protein